MKWYREPLVHFLGIGALLFGVFALVKDEANSVDANRIEITASDVERLQQVWTRQWNRPPTETELKGLIESHLREEVLYREGLALGLDQNDTIIRRRLAQKMEFLFEDLAIQGEPTEEDLKAYFDRNKDKYILPARVSFSHIYFNVDRRGQAAYGNANRLLKKLRSNGSSPVRVSNQGDRFMLEYDYAQKTQQEVANVFGRQFAERPFKAQKGIWQGPIESGYGLHLVQVRDRIESRLPQLDEVRDSVQLDFLHERRRVTNKKIYEQLKARYEIVVVPFTDTFDVAQN